MDVLTTPPRYELKYHLELNSNISNSFFNLLNEKFIKPYEDKVLNHFTLMTDILHFTMTQ